MSERRTPQQYRLTSRNDSRSDTLSGSPPPVDLLATLHANIDRLAVVAPHALVSIAIVVDTILTNPEASRSPDTDGL
jgi:hypothetical protein